MGAPASGNFWRMDGPASFGFSGIVHGLILAWVAFGTPPGPDEPRQSIYDMQIKPGERKIVWYRIQDKLPEIAPARTAAKMDRRPPRAVRKFRQPIVAGPKETPKAPQMIWAPAPAAEAPKPLPAPNVIAIAEEQRPVRPFVAPEQKRTTLVAPVLPDAPETAAQKLDRGPELASGAAGPTRRFSAPARKETAAAPVPSLPEAPKVTAGLQDKPLNIAGRSLAAPVRPLAAAPRAAVPAAHAPALPDAPETGGGGVLSRKALDLGTGTMAAPVRGMDAMPRTESRAGPAPALPDAPSVAGGTAMGDATLAIVSLNPSKLPEVPVPAGSVSGGFSAGPVVRKEGSEGSNAAAVVPGLMAGGGPKMEAPVIVPMPTPAGRLNYGGGPPSPTPPGKSADPPMPTGSPGPRAAKLSSAPDPMLQGRDVYSLAIQMPNITSYTGSWLVWFAEREKGVPGVLRPPAPLRKVDPRYVPAAAEERVQGVVRLAAVIRKDGHVEGVTLLRHLDDRLDRSAAEALAKWVFEPAMRAGAPVEIDAVFEVPFRLMPKPLK